jgi:hypothetical protein
MNETYVPKLIITGHGRHGKDTFGDMLSGMLPWVSSMSSSLFCLPEVFRRLHPLYGYETAEECYEDRSNHREEWYQIIRAYNSKDRGRLARELFRKHTIYVGLRDWEEFLQAREIADLCVWIDRSKVLPPESASSLTISAEDCDVIVDNNGTLDDLRRKVVRFAGAVYHALDLE